MNTENNTPHKGIYLLPNLFTTAALFSGFYAIIAAINGKFEIAAIAIFIAMVLDGLDGRVARLTNTESEFGAQYDSLAIITNLICQRWQKITKDRIVGHSDIAPGRKTDPGTFFDKKHYFSLLKL